MTSEPKCPFCERPITAWAVMKAPLPSAIRCPHCRRKIRVRGVGIYLTGYALIVVALATFMIVARRRNLISGAVFITTTVAFLVALEFVTSVIVFRRAKFVKPGA
jgi:predicted lysophospholipase L1 biosynthesis ABC-type transport system permease subunit